MSRRTDTELVDDILGAAQRVMTDYSGVNIDIVWQIAHVELPRVLKMLGGSGHGDEGGSV